jgi:hypothetical protein
MAQTKIEKAIMSLQRALENLQHGNKRLSVGDLDYSRDFIIAATHMLIAEIKDEEGKF